MSLHRRLLPLLLGPALGLCACTPRTGAQVKAPTVSELRAQAARDVKQTGAWLLAELLSPDGSVENARQARKLLDHLGVEIRAEEVLRRLYQSREDIRHLDKAAASTVTFSGPTTASSSSALSLALPARSRTSRRLDSSVRLIVFVTSTFASDGATAMAPTAMTKAETEPMNGQWAGSRGRVSRAGV